MSEQAEDLVAANVPVQKVTVDLRAWVESARTDPVLYRDRQVTEIVLTAIGLSADLSQTLVLKGGTLMALAFRSTRVTADIDFTATQEPEGFQELLVAQLDTELPRAARQLGYLDLTCRVQGVKKHPRPTMFEEADFPALEVRVGSASRKNANELRALEQGRAARISKVEISFRDQVYAFQELMLNGTQVAIQAFSQTEIVAEKLRALLQQVVRNRGRRQDVYDLALLIEQQGFDTDDQREILSTLIAKCRSRGIEPTQRSFADPEIAERAARDWDTLKLEVDDIGDFSERFAVVRGFYEKLPWGNLEG
jgi:predicted nucleotidyltransferase component of viral defense system